MTCHCQPLNGLSPRVRGNQGVRDSVVSSGGSIPACAGEPPHISIHCSRWRVYPRVCGGTLYGCEIVLPDYGLSPRVRGNHDYIDGKGSAPGVYPRVCGGTH